MQYLHNNDPAFNIHKKYYYLCHKKILSLLYWFDETFILIISLTLMKRHGKIPHGKPYKNKGQKDNKRRKKKSSIKNIAVHEYPIKHLIKSTFIDIQHIFLNTNYQHTIVFWYLI